VQEHPDLSRETYHWQ